MKVASNRSFFFKIVLNKGIPYSVFMPVDNLARYWYNRYTSSREDFALGPIMHAIQDASIPHHAAGYCGNWHSEYEEKLNELIPSWLGDTTFQRNITKLFTKYSKETNDPPTSLSRTDYIKVPAKNWKIDLLVTWVALNAFDAYSSVHNSFRNGYKENESANISSMKKLTEIAIAICMLILLKLSELDNG